MHGDEAAERHEMNEPSEPLAVDGTPRVSMALPSGRTVSAARERSQAAMEDVRRLTNMLGNELRDLEIYAREQSSEVRGHYQSTEASRAYIDMADRIKAIRGEA